MQVIAKEFNVFWKLRIERKRDNMKVNDFWILLNLRVEARKSSFSFNSSRDRGIFRRISHYYRETLHASGRP